MDTITLPKTEYETLKKKASLYEKVFRLVARQNFGVEMYSDKRAREFAREDRLDRGVRQKFVLATPGDFLQHYLKEHEK